jgi:hypothetical protein
MRNIDAGYEAISPALASGICAGFARPASAQ